MNFLNGKNWTKYHLVLIYHFDISLYSVEVKQHKNTGMLRFRVKKIIYPFHSASAFNKEKIDEIFKEDR